MEFFSLEGLAALALATGLLTVLGLDTVARIAVEARRAPIDDRPGLRRLGVGGAIFFRLSLLFVVLTTLSALTEPLVALRWGGWIDGAFSAAALLLMIGGYLVLQRAAFGVSWLFAVDNLGADVDRRGQMSTARAYARVGAATLISALQAVLAAVALTDDFTVIALAVVFSSGAMIWFAEDAARVLAERRGAAGFGYLALALVGAQLIAEGAAAAGLVLLARPVAAASPAALYASIFVLGAIFLLHRRWFRRLMAEKRAELRRKL